MLFRGNELKKSFEMSDLDFCNAENELISERKRTQIGPKNRQRTAFTPLRTHERDRLGAAGRALRGARENVNHPATGDRESSASILPGVCLALSSSWV
jgi:hypothetical protein